jgi:hypothetical protein
LINGVARGEFQFHIDLAAVRVIYHAGAQFARQAHGLKSPREHEHQQQMEAHFRFSKKNSIACSAEKMIKPGFHRVSWRG